MHDIITRHIRVALIVTYIAASLLLAFLSISGSNPFLKSSTTPVLATEPSQSTNDWPQVARNPQHTGYSPEVLGTNFKVSWTYAFQPDRVGHHTQAIVYRGKVFVGTQGANNQEASMYAIDATQIAPGSNPPQGVVVWKTVIGSPITNSVAADSGMVFFGTMGGKIYALYTDTESGHTQGQIAWQKQVSKAGFSAAPVVADGKVLIGGRDGYFYALNQNDGSLAWKYNTGSPILQTAAYNNGKTFFGTLGLHVYALKTSPQDPNSEASILAWKSKKLKGMAIKDHYPLVYRGKVFVRPVGGLYWYLQPVNYSEAEQNAVLAIYDANPDRYNISLILLDENTGLELPPIIHDDVAAMSETPPLPCVDRDGHLVVQTRFEGSWPAGLGRADLSTRKIIQPLSDGTGAGYGNHDENISYTCTNNLIIHFKANEFGIGATYNGYFNLDTSRWTSVPQGATNREMSIGTETQGNGQPTISNGMVYHIGIYNIVARTTR